MRKKSVVSSLLALIAASATQAADFTPQINNPHPNIVLILAEDMNARLGSYGDPNAVTPNIDALAKESVRFTHAFTMAGVSAPSRAGLITGMPPAATGLQHMRTKSFEHPYLGVPPSWVKAYPELLRRNGYFTYNDTKTDYQFSPGAVLVGPFSLWDAHGSYDNMDDLKVPMAWRNYDLKNKPFFINLNPQITHESGLFTKENAGPDGQIAVKRWDTLRSFYTLPNIDPGKLTIDPYWPDTPEVRQELALFYKNINVMDQQVGNIIKGLKQDGLWNNTIVIFASDNGDGLPRHKREGYDSGTHVPLIIHLPDKYKPKGWKAAGDKDDRLVSFEDLAPTILGFTGTPVPSYMNGYNLASNDVGERKYLFSERGRMGSGALRSYFVRDRHYQYVQNIDKTANGFDLNYRNQVVTNKQLNEKHRQGTLSPEQEAWFASKPDEELYNIDSDPWQLNNLAAEKSSASKLLFYRKKLEEWRNQFNDHGIIPESQMVKDIQGADGSTPVTLGPVAEYNALTNKIYIASRTEGASVGYSTDGKTWQLYTGAFMPPAGVKDIAMKAVRYGWDESDVVHFTLP